MMTSFDRSSRSLQRGHAPSSGLPRIAGAGKPQPYTGVYDVAVAGVAQLVRAPLL